jgi:hypothetical protein
MSNKQTQQDRGTGGYQAWKNIYMCVCVRVCVCVRARVCVGTHTGGKLSQQ